MSKISSLISLIFILMLANGCASLVISKPSSGASGNTSKTSSADARITNQVNSAFVNDGSVPAFDIKVVTNKGTVTLTGLVSSKKIKQRARDLAASVSGVRAVRNYIKLQ